MSFALRLAIFFLCFTSVQVNAQFTSAEIGVNGLTCSVCSRSVEMHIRKLEFVADVRMNLQKTEGTVVFVPNKKVDMEKLAHAVTDAGFSVRFLKANFHPKSTSDQNCFTYAGDRYVVVNGDHLPSTDSISISFLGKEYMTTKDYKKWQTKLKNTCTSSAGSLYYITL